MSNEQSFEDERSTLQKEGTKQYQNGSKQLQNKFKLLKIFICFNVTLYVFRETGHTAKSFVSMQSFQSSINRDICREIFVLAQYVLQCTMDECTHQLCFIGTNI